MESFPVNPADILIVLILLVSGGLAFARGFVRESLGLGAWIGAAFATLYAFPEAKGYLRSWIDMTLLADAITGLAIFVVTLVILVVMSHLLTARIRGSRLGAIDRSLGFAFGLLRGAIVVCLAYMLLVWAVPEEDRPGWIEEARFMPWVHQGAEVIRAVVPKHWAEEGETTGEKIKRKGEAAIEAERVLRELTGSEPTPEPGDEEEGTGYSTDERRGLDNVIETIE